MSRRERFGPYVVLRTLAEDVLGPTWRLGRVGDGERIDDLVLARGFSGSGLLTETRSLREILDHPFVARTREVLEAGSRTVVAWEYLSGHSLRQLLQRAAERRSPLAAELAVLIVERLAQGVAAAAEKQVGQQPLVHGLLCPELVWITNDGEIKALGFEVGAALARRHHGLEAIAPFVAPEVRGGTDPLTSSDVYSLGAILFSALTGSPPPLEGAAAAATGARGSEDGAPLAPELVGLLTRCLGPASNRPESADAVHVALREHQLATGHRVGPFELAYALHGLLGDEIALEARELERGGVPEEGPAALEKGAPAAPREVAADRPPPKPAAIEPTAPMRRRVPWPAVAAAGAAVVAIGVVLAMRGGSAPTMPPEQPPASPTATAARGPSPEEIEAQIRSLVAKQTEDLAAGLRERGEAEIRALEAKLAEAQGPVAEAPAAAPAPAPRSEPGDTPADRDDAGASTIEPTAGPVVASKAPPEAEPAPRAAPERTAPSRPPASGPAEKPPTTTPAVTPPRPQTAPASATAARLREVDLVTPGPGVEAPKLLRFATPEYPLLARRTKVQGTVVLSLLIDEKGRVTDVKFLKRIEQDVGLNEAAEKAARSSTFQPATKDGVAVKIWHTLPVPFSLE